MTGYTRHCDGMAARRLATRGFAMQRDGDAAKRNEQHRKRKLMNGG